jgi:hypothetical protein
MALFNQRIREDIARAVCGSNVGRSNHGVLWWGVDHWAVLSGDPGDGLGGNHDATQGGAAERAGTSVHRRLVQRTSRSPRQPASGGRRPPHCGARLQLACVQHHDCRVTGVSVQLPTSSPGQPPSRSPVPAQPRRHTNVCQPQSSRMHGLWRTHGWWSVHDCPSGGVLVGRVPHPCV